MPDVWLDDAARRAFTRAVDQIEAVSSAEVVIAVRRAARAWPHVSFLTGLIVAWAVLAFMMYGEPTFALWSFLVDPFIAGAAIGWAASAVPSLVRWTTPGSVRYRAVVTSARAAFVERRVHLTRTRTGVLIYVALAERMAVVVPDDGVRTALGAAALASWERQINAAMVRGGVATAQAVGEIATVLAIALPRATDDVNELQDEIDHDVLRRPRS